MKNPNGYGSIYKLSGRRRKPYAVIVTTGRIDGKQIRKYIGYFESRAEANICLAEYNKSPSDFFADKYTFTDIYEGWMQDRFFADGAKSEAQRNYEKAYKNCAAFYDRDFRTIRLMELQSHCDGMPSYNQAVRVKGLISQMSEWAIARDLAQTNYASKIQLKQKPEARAEKTIFSEAEIESLSKDSTFIAEYVMVLLYTGLRINELLDLRRQNCHINEQYIYIEKSKTNTGIRIVPIHSRIFPIVKKYYEQENEYVFPAPSGIHFTYTSWSHDYFYELMKKHGMNHTTHETRHTFISRAVMAGCREQYIQKIVGHVSMQSLTIKVYTHIEIQELLNEIEKIK